jgi:hypothetical protein
VIVTEVRIEASSAEEAYARLGDTGHVRRHLADVLDETARLGAQSAEIYAPSGTTHKLERAISSEHARLQPDGSLQAVAGVAAVDPEGLPGSANEDYPFFVHEGTGLYGALKKLIEPKTAPAMVFPGKTGLVIARRIKGQESQPFVGEAFEDVNVYLPQRLDQMARRIVDG